MEKLSLRMPPIGGLEVKDIATMVGAFAGTVIDSPKFSDAEKRQTFIDAKAFINRVAQYVARYDLEEPDLIWLDKSLQLMRRMLIERGLLGDDSHEGF
jgi:hypothetical protein